MPQPEPISGPPVLFIPELLLAIFGWLNTGRALGTLANASLVCSAWMNVALDTLWEDARADRILEILAPLTLTESPGEYVGLDRKLCPSYS